MSNGQRVWSKADLDLLCSDWSYWVSNKLEAELLFNRTWNAIKIKACYIGCKTDRFNKSNKAVTGKLNDYINGLLLSDGSVSKIGRYTQASSQIEWLNRIKDDFSMFGVNSTINNGHHQTSYYEDKPIKSFIYNMWTKCYVEFKELRKKWYPEGKKIVPNDIMMTPECVGNWYLGDGYINTQMQSCGIYYTISIATCGFETNDIEFLKSELNDAIGVNSYIAPSTNYICISRKKAVIKFLDYIKDIQVPCYSYKFPSSLLK